MTYCTHELRARRVDEAFITLRLLRRKHRLTIPELAAMLQVHPDTLQRWETGLNRPGPRYRKRLAEFHARWGKHARELQPSQLAASADEQRRQAELERAGQKRITGT